MEMITTLTLTYLQHLDLSYSFVYIYILFVYQMGPSTLKILCDALKKEVIKRPLIKYKYI